MSGHGENPIFFNKKIKIGHLITSQFYLTPSPAPPRRSGGHNISSKEKFLTY